MTKTYKIGNKEIQGITKNELSHLASKHRRLWYILRDLLEALSDKEELPKRGECTCACHITTSFGHTGKCCEGTEDVGNRVAPTGGFSGSSGVSL